MNRFLARSIGFYNSFLAVILVLGGVVIGAGLGQYSGRTGVGVVLGLIVGIIVAVIVCGVLALFIEMRHELIKIRSSLESRTAP
jgi:uncharacterized membrane protein